MVSEVKPVYLRRLASSPRGPVHLREPCGLCFLPTLNQSFLKGLSSFLVNNTRIQAENPSLDITLWNQPRNLVPLNIDRLPPAILQCLIELRQSILNRMNIRIDH